MPKIMFNDFYGLTDAVLQGRKTMTRRFVGNRMTEDDIRAYLKGYTELANKCAQYKIGEVVAVAQSYKDCGYESDAKYGWCYDENEKQKDVLFKDVEGWNNKMFVKAHLMPHQIQITDIKVERLQAINDIDCAKEGVRYFLDYGQERVARFYIDAIPNYRPGKMITYDYVKDAFAALIDKVSGKGTWERNPWVFAYSFELVK